MVNNNVTINKSDENFKNYYNEIKNLINERYNDLHGSISDASDELLDEFDSNHKLINKVDDRIDNLEIRLEGLYNNVEGLVSKAEQFDKKSIPIQVDIPSYSSKPFVSDDGDETFYSDDENTDASEKVSGNENSFSGSAGVDDIGEDESREAEEDTDDYGAKAATKADMQKLADYIKEETEKSRPTLPKEAAIAAGAVGIGVILRKYAMILGGRNDVFR